MWDIKTIIETFISVSSFLLLLCAIFTKSYIYEYEELSGIILILTRCIMQYLRIWVTINAIGRTDIPDISFSSDDYEYI